MQNNFIEANEVLTSTSDYLKCKLQYEAAGSVMGLRAEGTSEEEIVLLGEEVLLANGRFIDRTEAIWKARVQLRAQQHG
jgi:hypothetical protein